jgi:hypothetical protein
MPIDKNIDSKMRHSSNPLKQRASDAVRPASVLEAQRAPMGSIAIHLRSNQQLSTGARIGLRE